MRRTLEVQHQDAPKISEHGIHATHAHERFPTRDELMAFVGKDISDLVSTEMAFVAYGQHLERSIRFDALRENRHPLQFAADLASSPAKRAQPFLPAESVSLILTALRSRRVNHRTLDSTERNRFNNALKLAHGAGTYSLLAAIHSEMTAHRMHSMSGPVGTQRFLPWHRLYVLRCENLLRTYEPSVRIPYWDYANDHARPDWVWRPPDVNRGTPNASVALPTQAAVNYIIGKSTYTDFTFSLETGAHNDVHNWCNGTITSPPTAAYDPIFWLLHANVDRLWDTWQMNHTGVPVLKAMDWVMDPFEQSASDADSVIALGYWYL